MNDTLLNELLDCQINQSVHPLITKNSHSHEHAIERQFNIITSSTMFSSIMRDYFNVQENVLIKLSQIFEGSPKIPYFNDEASTLSARFLRKENFSKKILNRYYEITKNQMINFSGHWKKQILNIHEYNGKIDSTDYNHQNQITNSIINFISKDISLEMLEFLLNKDENTKQFICKAFDININTPYLTLDLLNKIKQTNKNEETPYYLDHFFDLNSEKIKTITLYEDMVLKTENNNNTIKKPKI